MAHSQPKRQLSKLVRGEKKTLLRRDTKSNRFAT